MSDDDDYYLHEDLDRGDSAHQAPRSKVFAAHLNQPATPVAPRQRYRATQYDRPIYDVVEDDDQYSQGESFDAFDQKSMQQPYEDRQRQAVQGKGRLSLAPGPSKYFSNAAPSQLQTQYYSRDDDDGYAGIEHQGGPEQGIFGQLSHFAYGNTQPPGSSSDVQVGPSSSPALRAARRRAEQNSPVAQQHAPGLQSFGNERHTQFGQNQDSTQPLQQAISTNLQTLEHEERFPLAQPKHHVERSYQHITPMRSTLRQMDLLHAPPIVQGIRLVPITCLPDRLRTVFPYPTFNAVQSKCFDKVFNSGDNFVLASPTGSGKTAILELAICRAVATSATGQYKVIYQAPTKALCSERQRDWETKFNQIGLKCAELTGDSDALDLRNVQSANIIVTTPEKWDSITRKWKDHEKLMRLIRLFLIDEVHILKEDRGAVLEAVISRMKSIGTEVRFVALSATVPNFQDVAAWLGKSTTEPYSPAAYEKFGEEFRPVKLRRHVCGYACNNSNDFAFEKGLDARLPEVISKYSESKPIMIFCATRNSTVNTAKLIANWWISRPVRDRMWNPPSKIPAVLNKDLRDIVTSGVAFHHAGLDLDDRMQVEKAFLTGEINVICCTSTLAVGVNLPCHLVIIKNTLSFTAEGLQEYSDLEMMQMLGRAGRPQFDDSAIAVIMTRQTKVRHYETLVTGQKLLESKLHLNLIDHLNAEIGLGTISDLPSARKWLGGTFLYIRLQKNPAHYKLEGATRCQNIEEQVDDICFRGITLLRENNLVSGQEYFRCTDFGHAMARYYVHFSTMKVFMGLQSRSSPSEILSAISQASEFSNIRFRQGEKGFYKGLNKSPSVRWSIPVNLDLPAQKVSLIIQSVLGSADISWDGEMVKYKSQYIAETQIVFKNIHSLIRCIIDCQICLDDATSIHSALLLERSLGARAWDDSPLQMKQIEGIGVVAVRKFVNAGIRCMDDLEGCDPHRIETIVGRNPPFGLRILDKVKQFPKLRVSIHVQPPSVTKVPNGVKIQVKAEIGFINEKLPHRFAGKPVYVCLLAETSDGRKIHFARISGPKLGPGQSLVFPVLLTGVDQSINCYVMCDGIAGTMRAATVKPQISPTMFPAPKLIELDTSHQPNMSKRRTETPKVARKRSAGSEDFGDDGIDDNELMKVSLDYLEFDHIDNYINPTDAITQKNTPKNWSNKDNSTAKQTKTTAEDHVQQPVQLTNGKWACNHPCKNRITCKHMCCKDGMDKPTKKKVMTKRGSLGEEQPQPRQVEASQKGKETQTKLQLTTLKRKSSAPIEELDLTQQEKKTKSDDYSTIGPREFRELHQLHKTVQRKDIPSSLHSVMHKKPAYCYSQGGEHNLAFMHRPSLERPQSSSDYGDVKFTETSSLFSAPQQRSTQDPIQFSDLPELDEDMDYPTTATVTFCGSETFGDDDSLLGDAMIGLADSQSLRTEDCEKTDVMLALGETADLMDNSNYREEDLLLDIEGDSVDSSSAPEETSTAVAHLRKASAQSPQFLYLEHKESSQASHVTVKPSQSMLEELELKELKQPNVVPPISYRRSTAKSIVQEDDASGMLEAQSVESVAAKGKPVPKAFKDLEPWLFQEFGDIVELVDG